MAVADVPVRGLDLRGSDLTAADLLAVCFLSDHLGGVVCHHHGEQFFVGHLGFVHMATIRDAAGFGKRRGRFAEWFGGVARCAGVL